MQTLLLILKLLPLVLEIVRMIQLKRLTAEATDEMLADLEQTADYLIMRSDLARTKVDTSDDAILLDPNNRDRT